MSRGLGDVYKRQAMSVAYQGTDVIMNSISGIIVAAIAFFPLYSITVSYTHLTLPTTERV
ncbi:hypothetical protein JMUB7531_29160 [Staphylococcus aureus]